ncbi:hypothetical protein MNBD_PLANCTO03-255, partial [hydrothermal vent metagenome]
MVVVVGGGWGSESESCLGFWIGDKSACCWPDSHAGGPFGSMTQKKHLNPQADDLLQQIDELEGRLGSARDELETSTQLRALGLLAGAIAHEFNNILTPVLSYARVALDSPEDAELSRKALEKAAEGVERASRIASSVLSLAGRDGSTGAEPPFCSPTAALRGALACLGQPLEAEGIELRTKIDPEISLRMRLTDLEHVLLNLLLNACRAMGSGGGVVEVVCRGATVSDCSTWNTAAEPGELAVLEFRDTGPG